MRPNAIAILFIVYFMTSAAADVTLYGVVDPDPTPTTQDQIVVYESETLSAVGVDSGGSTTYAGSGVQSLIVEPEGATTRTLLSTPVTYSVNFVEDKSGYHASDVLSCTFMAGGKGTCVAVDAELVADGAAGVRPHSVVTSMFSGSVVPVTTIRDPTTAAPTTPTNGAGGLHFPSILAMVCLSVVYPLL